MLTEGETRAPLALSVLGPLEIACGGQPVRFPYEKVRALLVYLAVEAGQAHTRDFLAELLWPDKPPEAARHSLSQALAALRRALATCAPGTWPISVTRTQIAFDGAGRVWLDYAEFLASLKDCQQHAHAQPDLCAECARHLARAAELYRGDFLAHSGLGGSPAFEHWMLGKREALRRSASEALSQLADCYEAQQSPEQALAAAQQLIELDTWNEAAYRRLMRLRARAGQRNAALALYDQLRRLLADELGVEPEAETAALEAAIRSGQPGPQAHAAAAPASAGAYSAGEAPPAPPASAGTGPQRVAFVGREPELAWLAEHLAAARAGDGRVVFVLGEAGRGKSSLLAEFARRALSSDDELLALGGICNAVGGLGDSYLPFRDVLGALAGAVEAASAASPITRLGADRLPAGLPVVARALLEQGPDLPGTLVPAHALAQRARAARSGTAWAEALAAHLERSSPGERPNLDQQQLLEQCAQVLRRVAEQHTLLIALDDLQWADGASLALLFHLGRRLERSRILVVGAYRPSEVGGQDQPHPLELVTAELAPGSQIDLNRQPREHNQAFVSALVDARPNRLGDDFRVRLLRHTNGNALFTLELLHELRARGNVRPDADGLLVEAEGLRWDALPARVEAVIEGRLRRLYPAMREALTTASVEGEVFTAQVVAHVQGADELGVLRQFGWLARQQRLVQEQDEVDIGGQRLARYRFSHALFQDYLYRQLGAGERRALHRRVVEALEALYGQARRPIVAQLAHHSLAAGDQARAFHYLCLAGDQARQRAAMDEAARQYAAALEAWPQADPGRRADTQRQLGDCLLIVGNYAGALDAYQAAHDTFNRLGDRTRAGDMQRHMARAHWEQGDRAHAMQHYQSALAILEAGPETAELAWTISTIAQMHMLASEHELAVANGERALGMARRLNADDVVCHALCTLGTARCNLDQVELGVAQLEESLALALAAGGVHDACRAYTNLGEIVSLSLCRYDQARAMFADMLAYTRQANALMFTGVALYQLGQLTWFTGRWQAALDYARQMREWMDSHAATVSRVWTSTHLGRLHNDLGQPEQAWQILEPELPRARSLDDLQSTLPHLAQLARAYDAGGRQAEAAALMAEYMAQLERTQSYDPNATATLLFVCQWYARRRPPGWAGPAQACLARLMADTTPQRPAVMAAAREAQGALAIAQDNPAEAVRHLQAAVEGWHAIGHTYDQVRALIQLGSAHSHLGEAAAASAARQSAHNLAQSLAAQLPEDADRERFLRAALSAAA
jgi:DNA-binding SARP family transcriptional activator